jgi:hypothetical protein
MHPRLLALLLFAGTTAAFAGCGNSGPDVFAEGEALEASGKLEEAARKFELTCAYAPKGERCPAAAGRAAEARIKAAEKAIGDKQFVAAERLLCAALFTADDARAQTIAARAPRPRS